MSPAGASIVVARPDGMRRLVLLFHGVGSSAANLVPVGEAIARACPDAMVVSVDAPHASTLGAGREWFSVLGISEDTRPARVAQAMPLFLHAVVHWQQAAGVGPEGTVLVGFSQGAIMSLESTQQEPASPAQRVIALAGRFAQPVRRAPAGVHVHLVHGAQDGVVPHGASISGARELEALGANVTLDLVPGLGHGIDARVLALVLRHLGAAP